MPFLRQAMLILRIKIINSKATIINQKEWNPMPVLRGSPEYTSIDSALLDYWQPCSCNMIDEVEAIYTFKRPAE